MTNGLRILDELIKHGHARIAKDRQIIITINCPGGEIGGHIKNPLLAAIKKT